MKSSPELKNRSLGGGSGQGIVYMESIAERKLQSLSHERQCSALRYGLASILGASHSLQKVLSQARAAACNNSHVLLQGDSGTGKELFAQSIHELSRADGPFVAINCGALPSNLVESELFGYEAGTFTGADRRGRAGKFELANGGTLFLDEIGDMPLWMQPVLLRVIEEKRVMRLGSGRYIPLNFRVIAATNQDLNAMVVNKRFRQDLYYRLSAFKITLPPLKERGEDLPLLTQHFVQRACLEMNRDSMEVSPEAAKRLMCYNWPGNIRQLENAMTYAVSMAEGGIIKIDDLPEEIIHPLIYDHQNFESVVISLSESEKRNIQIAMDYTNYNVIIAARLLKISKSTLYRKLREYEICSF